MNTAATSQASLALEKPAWGFELDGARVELVRRGRRVTGQVVLKQPNIKGRRRCRINYQVPHSWASDEELLGLCCTIVWFAHIGGLATIQHRHLCHFIQAHRQDPDGLTGFWICAGIRCYANRPWNRRNKVWMQLGRWIKERLGQDIEDSPEYQELKNKPASGLARPAALPRTDYTESPFDEFAAQPFSQWPEWAKVQLWVTLPVYKQRKILKLPGIALLIQNNLRRKLSSWEEQVIRTGSRTAVERLDQHQSGQQEIFMQLRDWCELVAVNRFLESKGVDVEALGKKPGPASEPHELRPVDWPRRASPLAGRASPLAATVGDRP